MREGLIEDLDTLVHELTLKGNIAVGQALTIYEAIDELKKWQESQINRVNKGVFLSGIDIVNQIQKINEERAKNGMPPV